MRRTRSRASARASGSTRVEARRLRLAVQHDVRDEVRDRELRLQAVGDVVVGGGRRATGCTDHLDRGPRAGERLARLGRRLDRAVAHQAARPRLDPVLARSPRGRRASLRRAEGRREARRMRPSTSAVITRRAAAIRAACTPAAAAIPTCSDLPSDPKAARSPPACSSASRSAAPARSSSSPSSRAAAWRRRPRRRTPRSGASRPRRAGATRLSRAHRLEAGRVGVERVADAAVERRGDRDRRRRGRRAQVRDARQVGVVEVEHVAGGAQPRDALEQPVAGRPGGLRRPLLAAAVRAREPVEQRRPVGAHRTATRHTQAISAPCSGSRAHSSGSGTDAEALGVDRHVHVGREDRQQRGDQPPARRAARALGRARRPRRRSRRRRWRRRSRACAAARRARSRRTASA